jgi:hypothetical protein
MIEREDDSQLEQLSHDLEVELIANATACAAAVIASVLALLISILSLAV